MPAQIAAALAKNPSEPQSLLPGEHRTSFAVETTLRTDVAIRQALQAR